MVALAGAACSLCGADAKCLPAASVMVKAETPSDLALAVRYASAVPRGGEPGQCRHTTLNRVVAGEEVRDRNECKSTRSQTGALEVNKRHVP
jgi:hypothetical protein